MRLEIIGNTTTDGSRDIIGIITDNDNGDIMINGRMIGSISSRTKRERLMRNIWSAMDAWA